PRHAWPRAGRGLAGFDGRRQASGQVAMEIGFVGLGRMGGNMTLRLLKRGHRVIAFDLSQAAVQAHAAQGAVGAASWEDFVKKFKSKPRVMWIMVPVGDQSTQPI